MSTFLTAFCQQAKEHPDRRAFFNAAGAVITYGELDARSDALAVFLEENEQPGKPVAVYGHKGPDMLTCMFACMKSGRPYAPIDTSFPERRMDAILTQLDGPLVLCTEPISEPELLSSARTIVACEKLDDICSSAPDTARLSALTPIEGDDAVYLLFTSGSTGTPKGVVQRAQSIDLTSKYFTTLAPKGEGLVFFNRAPFSFDLSVFDFLIALAGGHTMFALDEATEKSLGATFEALKQAQVDVWVSTPSFLTMCLADKSFGAAEFPSIKAFLMCGETLTRATAAKCLERFPGARLINMYGPSETCGAVTDVAITEEMATSPEPLPVGTVSPFSQIVIADPETLEEVPLGTHGEILILGDTAAAGYWGMPEKTEACFFTREYADGVPQRCYRTGDEGFLTEGGMLHYVGRYDLQVKVNGYRIELGDIEENLEAFDEVAMCCVVPVERNGVNTALAAHVVVSEGTEAGRPLTKVLKDRLKEVLPHYMVPRTFTYHEALPTNVNGKIDRKALRAR